MLYHHVCCLKPQNDKPPISLLYRHSLCPNNSDGSLCPEPDDLQKISALNSPGFFKWIPSGDDAWKVTFNPWKNLQAIGLVILSPWRTL